ncbi:hypothetical protein FOA52_008331 [Chlamydomonas sp. UWO 241]|nr:hypothetical protein FOA52_008331 [Chlamydomonas sp. UWO 241]
MWEPTAEFKVTLVNHTASKKSVTKGVIPRKFTVDDPCWGYDEVLEIPDLRDTANGWLLNDALVLKVEVNVQREDRFQLNPGGMPCDLALKLPCGVELGVVSQILQLASPFFLGALEDVKGSALIPVDGSLSAWTYIMSDLYPLIEPPPLTLGGVYVLLPVVHKYDFTRLVTRLVAFVKANSDKLYSDPRFPSNFILRWLTLAEQLQLDALREVCLGRLRNMLREDIEQAMLLPDGGVCDEVKRMDHATLVELLAIAARKIVVLLLSPREHCNCDNNCTAPDAPPTCVQATCNSAMFLSCFTAGRGLSKGHDDESRCAPPCAPDVLQDTLAQFAKLGGLSTPHCPLSNVSNISGCKTSPSASPVNSRVALPATPLSLQNASCHGSVEDLQLYNFGRPSLNPSELVAPLTAARESRRSRQAVAHMSPPQPAKVRSATSPGTHVPVADPSSPQPGLDPVAGSHGTDAHPSRPQPAMARSFTSVGGHGPDAHLSRPQPAMAQLITSKGRRATAEAHASSSTISFAGFRYAYRDATFDWRLLHGIDVDAVVRLTDVVAVEDCLDTLRHGSLDGERSLAVKNCLQLFRLIQLAIEYVAHLRSAHVALLLRYHEAAAWVDRWVAAARRYIDEGDAFVAECLAVLAMSRARLAVVDGCRGEMEEVDQLYNVALDALEADDTAVRQFHFRKQRTELNWQTIHAVDVEDVIGNIDTATLDVVLHNMTYGSILAEDREELTPHHFGQLIPLAQCCLDYVLFQANATGALLDKAMHALQAASEQIPGLAAATHATHARVVALVEEAQGVSRPPTMHQSPQQAACGAASAQMYNSPGQMHPGAVAAAAAAQYGSAPAAFYPSPHPGSPHPSGGYYAATPSSEAPPQSAAAGGLGTPLLAAAMAGSGQLPPGMRDMKLRTADISSQMGMLEDNIRTERYKTDEMKRILGDLKAQLLASTTMGPGLSPDHPSAYLTDMYAVGGGAAGSSDLKAVSSFIVHPGAASGLPFMDEYQQPRRATVDVPGHLSPDVMRRVNPGGMHRRVRSNSGIAGRSGLEPAYCTSSDGIHADADTNGVNSGTEGPAAGAPGGPPGLWGR